jgi:hypothetical protein
MQQVGGNDNINTIIRAELLANRSKITMSQKDGFSTGFLLGSIVGGLVGGAIGALLANRQAEGDEPEVLRRVKARNRSELGDRNNIESARQSLESKIADLNGAIDEVRSSLNAVQLDSPLEMEPVSPRSNGKDDHINAEE